MKHQNSCLHLASRGGIKMTATYSGDPRTSDNDWLRFSIGDTNTTAPILQDAEIAYIVETFTSKRHQLAVAFRQCANAYAVKLVKRSLGPQSEDATKRHEYFATMANKYEKEQSYSGVPPLPDYNDEKFFEKNMMANES